MSVRETVLRGGSDESPAIGKPNKEAGCPTASLTPRREAEAAEALRGRRPARGGRSGCLAIALAASKKRGEPLPHILFDGPPGLGKTNSSRTRALHNECLGVVSLNMTSGPSAPDKKMDVMPYLTNASEGSILFIDEIHRLPATVEEFIYPAVMEDSPGRDVVLGEVDVPPGRSTSRSKKFTIIGATTRSGRVSRPLRDHFQMHEHLESLRRRGPGQDRLRERLEAEDHDHRGRRLGTGSAKPRDTHAWRTPGSAGSATSPPRGRTAISI